MRRREFLLTAGGAAGATAAASTAVAQEETATPTGTPTGNETAANGTATETASLPGAGTTETVAVGPGGEFIFEPGTNQPLRILPGTTVNFVWESDNHNIVVESQPEGANWSGHEPIENTGFEYSHTFEVTGTYEYFCQPHKSVGMVGTIIVTEELGSSGGEGGGGGGEAEVDPEEMGVPFQAHFVGVATILGIVTALLFTFFFLKYGETPHSGYPERD